LFFIFLSIVIIYLAVKQFTNIEEDPNPTTSSKSIIAAGIYNWTRNPMYLGLVIFQFGLGCAFISSEIISFSLLTLTIFNYFVVKREEEYLEKKFGDTYLVYKKRVRRWL
jgi:protein-S-isoprenylcysteine O-methyltransferase Ste14